MIKLISQDTRKRKWTTVRRQRVMLKFEVLTITKETLFRTNPKGNSWLNFVSQHLDRELAKQTEWTRNK